jgi:hypothetical protein
MFAIGYVTLKGLEKAMSKEYDIYATLLCEFKSHTGGMFEKRTHLVLVSQPMDDELHYCRIPMGVTDSIMDDTVKLRNQEAAANTAWELIQEWLEEHGHHWHEAVVGIPRDIEPLDGKADFLQRRGNTFVRVDKNDSD